MRKKFDELYGSVIVNGGFFEDKRYYIQEKERYWRCLEVISKLDLPAPAKILEIGGGQLTLLCKLLFDDICTVGDISERYNPNLQRMGIESITLDLMQLDERSSIKSQFDLVLLLEVIEHVPVPAYVILKRIEPLLSENGILILTTPNLFRPRNLIKMFLGVDFLDHFLIPEPGSSAGHQLEYSAAHLAWQIEKSGLSVISLCHDNLGRTGHSVAARIAHTLLMPLELRPKWRKGLIAIAKRGS